MASTAPGAKKKRIDYNVDGAIFDNFMKKCSNMGYAPQVVLEKAMVKFAQTGQV
ncbi:MAG: hypothetical protein AABX11_02675 [Nanoarchaeota archaeon]